MLPLVKNAPAAEEVIDAEVPPEGEAVVIVALEKGSIAIVVTEEENVNVWVIVEVGRETEMIEVKGGLWMEVSSWVGGILVVIVQ